MTVSRRPYFYPLRQTACIPLVTAAKICYVNFFFQRQGRLKAALFYEIIRSIGSAWRRPSKTFPPSPPSNRCAGGGPETEGGARLELDYDALLGLAAEVGYRLQVSGAEIYRVEESMQRLLQAYGQAAGQVFVIPNCIIVSLTTPAGHPVTCVRRIPSHGTDIYLLEAVNGLCRSLCAQTPPLDEARARIDAILAGRRSFSMPMQLLGYFLGTMFFGMLFGGTLRDGICSGICGVALGGCLTFMTRLGANLFFKTIAGGAVSALLALLLTWAGLGQNSDFVIIGALMALVPGLIFTNAIRDIMAGDMVSGITRAAEALLIGVAIALGTGFVLTAARMLGGM